MMITWQNTAVAVIAAATGVITVKCLYGAFTGSALVWLPTLAAWLGVVAALARRAGG